MVKLFLIRHGESIPSENDAVLSEKGVKQAKLLAQKLSSINISRVYVSDYKRALQTYEEYRLIKPNIPCSVTGKLREIYRVIIGGPERQGTDPEREKNDRKRADEIFQEILGDAKKDDAIALFIHGNIIKYFISKILGSPKANLWEDLTINDASISLIEVSEKGKMVKLINNIEHLESADIARFYNSPSERINYIS